ncbi:MAG: hypothetical protein K2L25_02600 [Alphaproteobacteria bacterium]|nr:hypothetical protein [Alphaproteobacteria bacterium]
MTQDIVESNAEIQAMVADNDRRNLAVIERARASGRINDEAARYLSVLYSDGLGWFREVFYFLGKCFGAPKAPVMRYDYETDSAIDEPIKIADINPLTPYLVQHRLDADPMRNQFFNSGRGHKIDLAVSSIVTVIVGAQKSVDRALDKVTGKYYARYVDEVCDTVHRVIASHEREASAKAVADKVRAKLSEKYISAASEAVLSIIGRGHENIAVELVRALDRVPRPRTRLQDVWRVKCLFDLIPQARTFIERVHQMMPDRVLSVRDNFYDMDNPRNYRDAKLIINIGTKDDVVPMEIICQVRTFFEYERKTHGGYEVSRKASGKKSENIERRLADFMEGGVKEYNLMVCNCLEDLFERVGWNILYMQDNGASMFDGFPRDCTLHYPQKIYDVIMDKLDNALENEVFHVTTAPAKLTQAQESKIFHYMARFVLVAAMPYMQRGWAVPSDTMAGKLFNFVMNEVQRYYKKPTND